MLVIFYKHMEISAWSTENLLLSENTTNNANQFRKSFEEYSLL